MKFLGRVSLRTSNSQLHFETNQNAKSRILDRGSILHFLSKLQGKTFLTFFGQFASQITDPSPDSGYKFFFNFQLSFGFRRRYVL